MTLVAMAFRWDGKQIQHLYAVCDRLLSSETSSFHSPFAKIVAVFDSWLLGYCGDPGVFMSMVRELKASGVEETAENSDAVPHKLRDIYQKFRKQNVEEKILSRYRLSLQEFLDTGFARFGERKFGEICKQIEGCNLGIEFLLAGWSPQALWDPRILTINDPGVITDHTLECAWAVGVGADIAQGHLDACFHSMENNFKEGLYRITEAKIMAEAARGVGPDTTLIWLDHRGISNGKEMPDATLRDFRLAWEMHRQKVPEEILQRLWPWPDDEGGVKAHQEVEGSSLDSMSS